MTTSFVWNELKKMVVIDHEISRIRKIISKEQEAAATARITHQKKLEVFASTEQAVRALQKQLDQCELSIKDLRTQLHRKEEQQARLAGAKEREAIQHEIEKLTKEIDTAETVAMTTLEQQELVKTALEKLKEEVALSQENTTTACLCSESKCQEHLAHITLLEKEWTDLLPQVPEALRKEYLQLRQRMANPAVPIVDNTCSACFTTLLGQEVMSLSTRTVIRCRSCYRFLYVADATTNPLSEK